jgi:hypothetical protein
MEGDLVTGGVQAIQDDMQVAHAKGLIVAETR